MHIDLRVQAFAAIAAVAVHHGAAVRTRTQPFRSRALSAEFTCLRADAQQVVAGRGTEFQRSLVATELPAPLVPPARGNGRGTVFEKPRSKLSAVHPGFRADSLLVVNFALPPAVSDDSTRARALYRALADRVARIPGVAAVTAQSTPPFTGGISSSPNEIEGHPLAPRQARR